MAVTRDNQLDQIRRLGKKIDRKLLFWKSQKMYREPSGLSYYRKH